MKRARAADLAARSNNVTRRDYRKGVIKPTPPLAHSRRPHAPRRRRPAALAEPARVPSGR